MTTFFSSSSSSSSSSLPQPLILTITYNLQRTWRSPPPLETLFMRLFARRDLASRAPDFLLICFQEVAHALLKRDPELVVSSEHAHSGIKRPESVLGTSIWKLLDKLQTSTYELVCEHHVGEVSVFVIKRINTTFSCYKVSEIETCECGLGPFWFPNKAAAGVSFKVAVASPASPASPAEEEQKEQDKEVAAAIFRIAFVGVHLAHGDRNQKRREFQLHECFRRLIFKNNLHIRDHDVAVFAGDFNFRLYHQNNSSIEEEEILRLIVVRDYERLLNTYDEFQNLKHSIGLNESTIQFQPTYKRLKFRINPTTSAGDDFARNSNPGSSAAATLKSEFKTRLPSSAKNNNHGDSDDGDSDGGDSNDGVPLIAKNIDKADFECRVGSNCGYDLARTPAYTDRILFASFKAGYSVSVFHYEAIEMDGYSDHNLVKCVLMLTLKNPSSSSSSSSSSCSSSFSSETEEDEGGEFQNHTREIDKYWKLKRCITAIHCQAWVAALNTPRVVMATIVLVLVLAISLFFYLISL